MATDRRYWDSDCFLGWLQSEPDKQDRCEQVLTAAEDGKVLIVTSALTIAEVLNLKGRPRLAASRRRDVERFFRQEYITVRNITRRVAELARDCDWDHGFRPKDALHVATALDASLTVLNTFDARLIRRSGKVGSPPLLIEVPSVDEPGFPFREGH